jgi:hypothetical protein
VIHNSFDLSGVVLDAPNKQLVANFPLAFRYFG